MLEAAALATDHLDALVLGAVRDVHGAVSARVHQVLDPVLDPVLDSGNLPHRTHDLVSAAAYAGVGLGLRGVSGGLRAADALGLGGEVDAHPGGRFLVAAVNGLIGDRLVLEGSALAVETAVRRDGRDVALDADRLGAAFPDAGDALVVFVHGLCESELAWRRRSRPARADGASAPSYGERLAAEAGWTPVELRVNTGVPVAESAVALSSVLGRLVEAWPVPVRRIALVGHSMGGLILRAACAVRLGADPWTDRVTDLVMLGTPHLGSPVERTVARGVRAGHRVPELAPFVRILQQRSAGILDLHDGMPEDEPLPHVRHHLVAATLSHSRHHPVARTVGDGLVPYASAVGLRPGGDELFPGAEILHVPRAHHFDLLNHDEVHAALRGWLANPREERCA